MNVVCTNIFVPDDHSRSTRNVLPGLHYQVRRPQGKLVRVVAGGVFDVAVDLRRSSPTFGRWVREKLSAENRRLVSAEELERLAAPLVKSGYGQYLLQVLRERTPT